jgi:chlorobactene glucosyltransferase
MSSGGLDLSLWVALGVGVAICGFFAIARVRYLSIPKLTAVPPGARPLHCMVVIPARNEEFLIARAVSSLPHDTVIVVDDHSSDRTAEAARKAGAGVVSAPDLPRGAVGKSNACLAGARLLDSKWILFADADACFAPGFLESAVGCAEASGLELLSIALPAELTGWVSPILFPYAQALFFCGVAPRADPSGIFNGQCLLVRREAYKFLGGHAAVLSSLVDDVKIAGLARRHRLTFGTVRTETLGHARFREPRASFRRHAARLLLLSFWIGGAILVAALVTALWLPALAWLMAGRHWLAAGIFAVVPTLVTLPWYKNLWRALLAPLAIYAMLPMVVGGAVGALLGRRVKWKGRTV